MRLLSTAVILSVLLTSCGHNGVNQRGRATPRPNTSVILATELQPFSDATLAIMALRPQWLSGRSGGSGNRPAVFINGVPTPGIETLNTLRTEYIREIRYLQAREADVRFGTGRRGAIVVTTFDTRENPALTPR